MTSVHNFNRDEKNVHVVNDEDTLESPKILQMLLLFSSDLERTQPELTNTENRPSQETEYYEALPHLSLSL